MNNEVKKLVEQMEFPVAYDRSDGWVSDAHGVPICKAHSHNDGNLIATAINNLQPKEGGVATWNKRGF